MVEGRLPKGLDRAEEDAELHQVVVAVGAALDMGVVAISEPAQGHVARRQGGLVEVPTTYEAPRSLVGAPVLDMTGRAWSTARRSRSTTTRWKP